MTVFIDTNILVYAYDTDDPLKQKISQKILEDTIQNENGAISPQIIGEFFVIVTRKIKNPMRVKDVLGIIDILKTMRVVELDFQLTVDAIKLHQKYLISYWDGLVIATAKFGECAKILSEDLQHGQIIDGIRIENPYF